jgi:putative molybdopterin biosynthesis protein
MPDLAFMAELKSPSALHDAVKQAQFLDVIGLDRAHRVLHEHLRLETLGIESVRLQGARGRVLAEDILAQVDVPGFDRSNVDGFAVRAEDVGNASDASPAILNLNPEVLTPGVRPACTILPGTATMIATGGMIPRGADAVVMVEHTDAKEVNGSTLLEIHRSASPGQLIAAAGSDIARGETVLRRGRVLTSREIGMLAAVGLAEIPVWRRPRVAIFSTGDEIVPPGGSIEPGQIYDSNAAILAAAVEEAGGEPIMLGIAPDNPAAISAILDRALGSGDIVLMSGGTSKGAGDIAYQIVARLPNPGIVVHGVALKPGKPVCLAVTDGKLVAVLPGFPTSAIFTFHEFIAPVIRQFARQAEARHQDVSAQLPVRIPSERGRTEYVLVSLMHGEAGRLIAYPTAKGSGAVTGFAQADGFFVVPALTEMVAAGTDVDVRLIGSRLLAADLVIIGSHCVGLDMLVGRLEAEGIRVKSLAVGSLAGLAAAQRGECDVAGIHLMDPETGRYNAPYVTDTLTLAKGYGRLQGFVYRAGDERFAACASVAEAFAAAVADPRTMMVNRNIGSGTRIVIDRLLAGEKPAGYAHATKSHNAVAAAVAQERADWGVAIETVARQYGLGFLPLQPERYDFVLPKTRVSRPAVQRFIALLDSPEIRADLAGLGFDVD